jgi:hypothetical protein
MRLTPGHPRLKTPGLKFWRRKREEEEEEGRNPPGVFYYCRTYYKAVRVGGQESGGHVLWETTTRGLCGLVCPSRTGTRVEPCTLTQGAPVFPGSSRLGNRTQNSRVAGARPNHQADRSVLTTFRLAVQKICTISIFFTR